MALTRFQTGILRLLAKNRIASGESYVAGGAALNQVLSRPRVSHDIDIFNDSAEAMAASAAKDRETLEAAGFEVEVLRNLQFMVEMRVSCGGRRGIPRRPHLRRLAPHHRLNLSMQALQALRVTW